MPLWEGLLDGFGLLLVLAVLYAAALIGRRWGLGRHGGTFELSHRVRSTKAGRGWLLGVGRYSGESLEWFRVFSLAPRPRTTWQRSQMSYDRRRPPEAVEQMALYPDHVVIFCQTPSGGVELAMSQASLTGFQAWLEARPPGADWSQ